MILERRNMMPKMVKLPGTPKLLRLAEEAARNYAPVRTRTTTARRGWSETLYDQSRWTQRSRRMFRVTEKLVVTYRQRSDGSESCRIEWWGTPGQLDTYYADVCVIVSSKGACQRDTKLLRGEKFLTAGGTALTDPKETPPIPSMGLFELEGVLRTIGANS